MEIVSISEQLLFATTRIEAITSKGTSTGTGFVFSYRINSKECLFIVTNKHVIADAQTGQLTFTQAKEGKPKLGVICTIKLADFEKQWFGHPDPEIDVAIIPLVPLLELADHNMPIFYRSIPQNLIPSAENIKNLDALEEIVFIGYPNGIWDNKNLLPIMRRGTTATPIEIDFQGNKQFLIDASVFPGSSGSPVLIINTGIFYNKLANETTIGSRVYFLGIVASVYFKEDLNEIKMIPAPTIDIPMATSRQMINLGVVFKASTIIETIEAFLTNRGIK